MPTPVSPSRARWSPLAAPLAALAATAAAFACAGVLDPHQPGHYPPCPVQALTGWHCPGCGGLRSAHAVAHGDLGAAVGANALAVAGFAVLAVALAAWLVRSAGRVRGRAAAHGPGRERLSGPPGRVLSALVLVLTTAFTLARNVPWGAALAP